MVRRTLGVVVSATKVTAVAVARAKPFWVAEAPYSSTSDLAEVLAQLASERPRRIHRAVVVLEGRTARTRTIEGLPKLRQADLVAHVRLNSRRYFVHNGDGLITDARPVPGGALVAAAPLPLVEAIASGLAAAGLSCEAIVPSGELGSTTGLEAAVAATRRAQGGLRLVPDAMRAETDRSRNRLLRRWAIAAMVSVFAAAVSRFASIQRTENAARRELAALGPSVDAALSVRRDLTAVTAALATVGAAPAGRYARLLADIARALPDSAFLATASFEPGAGRLTGYAPSATATVARLERLPRIRIARLDGPLTREVVGGRERERFNIVLTLARGIE